MKMETYFYLPGHHKDGVYCALIKINGILRKGDSVYIDKEYLVSHTELVLLTDKDGNVYASHSPYFHVYLDYIKQ